MPDEQLDPTPAKRPPELTAAGAPKRMSAPNRLFRWLDQRTGVHAILKESLDEPIPGGARLAYVFGSGLLYIFISQIITGLCLALYYVPSAETAHTSVAYITKSVAAGAFLRSLHYYGSSAMIVVLALHFLQTFLYGSFKGRRELLWISGAVLSFLVLGMGFTGYLLPWDQKAYFATAIGTNIVGEVPLIGNWLTRLLRGGDTIGTLTLSRFYVAHVFLIPAMIFAFIGAHILLFRKAGPAGPIAEDPISPKMAPEGFYPKQVLMDMTFALLIMVALGCLAYFHPVGLGPVADPANTQFLPRPEWYYLSFFEWLKFWEGPWVVVAVLVIPGLLAMLFCLMPFLDRSYERRPWRRPIPVLSVAIVLAGMLYLGMLSRRDDAHDPTVAAQLALQAQQEKDYGAAPFEPYIDTPAGMQPTMAASGPANPLIAHGRAIFEAHGCAGCHGAAGVGGIAPALVGIGAKLPGAQLADLLHHPDAKMIAGKMPSVDMSATDMHALLAYLDALGTSAATAPALQVVALTEAATSPQPASAKASASSDAVATGQKLFEQRSCAACHGQAGVGGRAPAMEGLVAGSSHAQILALLMVPSAKMKAGGMQAVAGTPAQLSSLVAYIQSMHGSAPVDAHPQKQIATETQPETSGRSPTPAATPQKSEAAAMPASPANATTAGPDTAAGKAVFLAEGCAACHGVNAGGTHFAPALKDVAAKFPGEALPTLLHHPNAKMRSGGMPPVLANPAQMKQLVAYLFSLDIVPATIASHASVTAKTSSSAPAQPEANNTAARAAAPVPLSPLALQGQTVFQHNACETCHGTGGLRGTAAAPGLAGTASMLPAASLENLLRHHSTQMKNGHMPPTSMNTANMTALVAYIRSMPATVTDGRQ